MLLGQRPTQEALVEGRLLQAIALASLVYTPVLMGYWFAPTLAAWRGMGPVQSLFYSFFATLRNWRAFLLYGLSLGVIGGIAPTLVLIIAMAVRPSSPLLSSVLIYSVVPAVLMLVPTLFASFYKSYEDIFTERSGNAEEAAEESKPSAA